MSKKSALVFYHKGIAITVDLVGRFAAAVDDIEILTDTLEEAKRKIDRELAPQNAKKQTVSLKIVGPKWHNKSGYSYGGKEDVGPARAVLTGMNRTSRDYQFEGLGKNDGFRYVLPDTDENFALLERLFALETELEDLQNEIGVRKVIIPGYGRIESEEYPQKLKQLEEAYSKALAAKGGKKRIAL